MEAVTDFGNGGDLGKRAFLEKRRWRADSGAWEEGGGEEVGTKCEALFQVKRR